MAVRTDFSGVVLGLSPVAGEAKGARIGPGPLRPLGVAVRAFRLVHVGIVGVGRRGGVTRCARC